MAELLNLEDLMEIRRTQPETRCIILYIIQRQDVNRFQPSRLDPIYVDKLQQAVKCGVELKALQVKWSRNKAYLVTAELPINFSQARGSPPGTVREWALWAASHLLRLLILRIEVLPIFDL